MYPFYWHFYWIARLVAFFLSFSSSSKSDENMCALTGNWSTCGISFGSLSQLLFFFRFSKNRHVHVHSVYVFQLQICSITTHFQAPNYMSNHVCLSVYQMQNSFTKHSRISKTYRYVFGVFFPFQFDWTAIFNVLRKRTHQMCGWLLFFRYFYVSEWVSVCVRSFPSVKIEVTNASMFVRMYSWLECGTKIYDQYFFKKKEENVACNEITTAAAAAKGAEQARTKYLSSIYER